MQNSLLSQALPLGLLTATQNFASETSYPRALGDIAESLKRCGIIISERREIKIGKVVEKIKVTNR